MTKNVMRTFNNPKRDDGVKNVFDLSQRHIFSAKAGQLIPVCCVDTVPGDKFELDLINIARTMPLNTAAFTRLKQSFDWVFVPYRCLWTRFNEFIAERNDPRSALYGTQSMDNPNMTPMYVPNMSYFDISTLINQLNSQSDIMGFNKADNAIRLLDMLGYGDLEHSSSYSDADVKVNLWHLLAYQKACCQFYRDSVHDPLSDAFAFNVDDVQGTSVSNSSLVSVRSTYADQAKLFELHYKPWKKDIVTGTMPTMQYGSVSAIPLSQSMVGTATVGSISGYANSTEWSVNGSSVIYGTNAVEGTVFANIDGKDHDNNLLADAYAHGSGNYVGNVRIQTGHSHPAGTATFPAGTTLFDVIALRKAEAIQKWKERTLRAGFHTDKQFEVHYGVSVDEDGRWCADFIGSVDSVINIDEVITTANNNYASGGSDVNNQVGDIAGKGVGVTNGSKLHFETNQFGVLMCIYSCTPEAEYSSFGLDQNNALIERFDYFTSEFENLGLQAVPQSIYNLFSGATSQVIGYGPRYWNYKTALDKVHEDN